MDQSPGADETVRLGSTVTIVVATEPPEPTESPTPTDTATVLPTQTPGG
ncbi:MAG: hypothetical protein ACRDWY_18050 [Actinomycetes bacterium]